MHGIQERAYLSMAMAYAHMIITMKYQLLSQMHVGGVGSQEYKEFQFTSVFLKEF